MIKVLYRFLVCLVLTLSSLAVYSQSDLGDALKGTKADAAYLASGYITPMLKVMGTGINAGWNNTAKAHKTLGFDLTITASPVFFPASDKNYEVDNSRLTDVELIASPNGTIQNGKASVPTIFGAESQPEYRYKSDGSTFEGPPGIDLKKNIGMNALPIPMVHLGVGIYKNTDVKLRFFPQQQFGDNKVSLFGIGVLHDVKQWIPGIKNLPFDLSAFVGYSRFKFETQLDEPGQTGNFEVTGTTIQGLISKKISVLTFYGGVGYNIAKASVALKGVYDLNNDGVYDSVNEKDPLALSATSSGPRATAGMRLKLAIFTLHGDYTLQKYSTLSVGFGFAVR